MSLRDCLNRAVEKGAANKDKAAKVLKTFDDLVKGHIAEGRSPIEANELAGRDVLDDIAGKTASA